MLIDRFGRVATDLRVSLTDRCNLRCTYCMPAEGLAWLPEAELLTDDEIVAAGRRSRSDLGITEVRFTGGEPLLRAGLWSIVARGWPRSSTARAVADHQRHRPRPAGRARSRDAGLDRVNVSLDTLDREHVRAADPPRPAATTSSPASAAAARAGLRPVKINAVLMRGVNDDEAPELLRVVRSSTATSCASSSRCRWTPSTAGSRDDDGHRRRDPGPAAEPVRRSSPAARARPRAAPRPRTGSSTAGPAHRSASSPRSPGRSAAPATALGSPPTGRCAPACSRATRPTCARCCAPGADDDEHRRRCWAGDVGGKQAGHGIDDPPFLQPARPMSAIGG